MKGFFPKYQTDIEHILRETQLNEDEIISIMDEVYTAYSLAEVTERELKRNRESYSIHYKRKADKYEVKAKAFDAYHSIISKHIEQQYSHNKHDMVKRFVKIHDEYESGEYNAKE